MRSTSRAVLRKKGFRLKPLDVVSLRIQSEIWQRCDWAAQAKSVNRNQFVRDTLADATREAKRPNPSSFRGLEVSGEELAGLERAAAICELPVDTFIHRVIACAVKQTLAKESAA